MQAIYVPQRSALDEPKIKLCVLPALLIVILYFQILPWAAAFPFSLSQQKSQLKLLLSVKAH